MPLSKEKFHLARLKNGTVSLTENYKTYAVKFELNWIVKSACAYVKPFNSSKWIPWSPIERNGRVSIPKKSFSLASKITFDLGSVSYRIKVYAEFLNSSGIPLKILSALGRAKIEVEDNFVLLLCCFRFPSNYPYYLLEFPAFALHLAWNHFLLDYDFDLLPTSISFFENFVTQKEETGKMVHVLKKAKKSVIRKADVEKFIWFINDLEGRAFRGRLIKVAMQLKEIPVAALTSWKSLKNLESILKPNFLKNLLSSSSHEFELLLLVLAKKSTRELKQLKGFNSILAEAIVGKNPVDFPRPAIVEKLARFHNVTHIQNSLKLFCHAQEFRNCAYSKKHQQLLSDGSECLFEIIFGKERFVLLLKKFEPKGPWHINGFWKRFNKRPSAENRKQLRDLCLGINDVVNPEPITTIDDLEFVDLD